MSEIIPFFKDKHIFITGSTGVIGKLLVETLLRKCEPAKLYLLIRTKENLDSAIRLQDLFQQSVFERLKKEKSNFIDRIEVVPGELDGNNLAISESDKTKLIENIEIVIHSGATVRFNEPIHAATRINIKGTLSVINLCHKMKKLQAFVHVSTLYSAIRHNEIEEKFYSPPIGHEEMIHAVENFNEEEMNAFIQRIKLDAWPNTYVFTKCIAEDLVRISAADLPTAIVRPGVVTCSLDEPVPGWIDNINAATRVHIGIQLGTNSVFLAHEDSKATMVPADMTVSCILAVTYETSLLRTRSKEEIPIYNMVPCNILTWKEAFEYWKEINRNFPHNKILRVINKIWIVRNIYLFILVGFILDGIPAILMDLILIAMNESPRLFKLYRRAYRHLIIVSPLITKKNNFHTENMETLWNSLCNVDKKLFNFNLREINWQEYLLLCHNSLILNILKDNPEENPSETMKKFNRLQTLQNVFTIIFFSLTFRLLWKILF